ncbi:MAG: M20/M25/M40 family metallo-hydrolase [Planctomycetes bacterium]|nr:M20/M25/M40 family metallo-hydrolase [Planctomycetota bacterium]
MKICRWIAVFVTLCVTVAVAQDGSNENTLREKVERALAEETRRLRETLVDLIHAELGSKGSSAPAGSLDAALALVTEDLLREHATYLAGDELEGRAAGYSGNDKATEYIAKIMKQAGLKPVGDKDENGAPTYWQQFRTAGRKTRNCLGLLEGTDPDLKREILVVGGHHDHLGKDDQSVWGRLDFPKGEDKIWNGADDNASGTSCVLGLIKAFGEGGVRTRRSILFMTFSAEESGLIGSRYYANHPIAPIEQHVFMLNLDMVGRNPRKPVEIHGVGSAEDGLIRKAVEKAVERAGLKATINDRVQIFGGDSDHSSFRDKGVPFTFFFSGFHADYHKVTDHPDKLAYDNMVKIAQASAHILAIIADGDASPRFKGLRLPDPGPHRPPRRLLGVRSADMTEEEYEKLGLAEKEGARKVDEVTEDSIAQKAGVQAGDYIVSLGGKKLGRGRELEDLRAALEQIEPGKEISIEVIRDGRRVTLKGLWEK